MSKTENAVPDTASQDLLFAALNQSGLSMLDSPASAYSDETDLADDPLASLGLLPPAPSTAGESSGRSSHISTVTTVQVVPRSSSPYTSTATTNAEQTPTPSKLITVTKHGAKIIKVPIPTSGTGVASKPSIIRLPLSFTSNGVTTPIIVRKTSNRTQQLQAPRIVTIGKSAAPVRTSTGLVASSAFAVQTAAPLSTYSSKSNPSSLVIDHNNPQKATYARVTVGNKKILIPVTRKPTMPNKVIIPTAKIKSVVGPAVGPKNQTKPVVLGGVSLPTRSGSPAVRHVAAVPASYAVATVPQQETLNKSELQGNISASGLNLGSLFVESAEKEVEEIPAPTHIPIVKPLVSDKNNNSDVINKRLIAAPSDQNVYNRNCVSPFSPVSDILTSLTNIRPHSPLIPALTANSFVNGHSASPAVSQGIYAKSNNEPRQPKHPSFARQNTVSGVVKHNADKEMKNPIARSHSVANFYKNAKSKSNREFSMMDLQSGPLESKKSTDELVEEEERQEEEVQHASTYAEYKPSKLTIGLPHPDSVVETSSLSSVPPPDIHHKLSIPEETIDHGQLSALQLETITYSCQKHSIFLPSGERAGFLIGDGAGVGKGRTIAGIIFENYLLGRKRALWFSVSNDLKFDSERDLRDIGAKNIHVHMLNKFKYGKISSKENSFVKKGVIFATYSSLIGESHTNSKYGTRLKQILHWCGKDFDGVIVFDECHKAKNLIPSGSAKPTKTGYTVLELQKRLPYARVIYASATGASEPRNMAYMSRIGLWGEGTPFRDFTDFIQAVERRGVGAMEMVAMDLKSRGAYIARQLSFHGVSFRITEVSLTNSFIKVYNAAVRLWVAAREAFQVSATLIDAEHNMKKTMWGQFWAAHQRFFKYLCIAAKVDYASRLAREAVKHGKCVVIGLQSTGEARTLDQLEKCGGELDDFVSTAKGVFQNLIENHFPAPNRKRVTDLFGEDFYKKGDSDDETKIGGSAVNRKRSRNKDKDGQPSSKRMHSSKKSDTEAESSDDGGFSDDDDKASKLAGFCSDASLDFSDEDIGKIFGGGSDSDEWGSKAQVTQKKKLKKVKKHKESDMDAEADRMLEEAGLKVAKVTSTTTPKQSEKTSLAALATDDMKGPEAKGNGLVSMSLMGLDPIERAQALKQELLDKLEALSLPNNTLDELIDALGGPENVAEMTGRKGRVVATDEGSIQYESRTENDVHCDMLNLAEKQRFMDGEKNIAIISEAASSGISLQSDRRARNQRRRLHITLELPWSADRAIQQFGRTHRSNQVNAPEYVFLISELAGEQRFASVVAKRLESLGALTHGDRRATETRDLSQYNFDNKFGRLALESVMKAVAGLDIPLVHPPATYPGLFFRDIRAAMIGVGLVSVDVATPQAQLEKEYNNITKFMNRILGMEVMQQNAVFQFFSDTLSTIVQKAKSQGQFDQGIMDVGSGEDCVERVNCRRFQLQSSQQNGAVHHAGSGYVELHTVKIERGMSWNDAEKAWSQMCLGDHDGFYLTHLKRNGKCMAVLCVESLYKSRKYHLLDEETGKLPDEMRMFVLHRPNSGKQVKRESLATLNSRYRRVEADEAKKWWERQHLASVDTCSHAYWQGFCTRQMHGVPCGIGKRSRTYHVLSGSVLAVWRLVERVLSAGAPSLYKMQIVRLKTEDGGKLVGLLIPSNCVDDLVKLLSNPAQLLKPHVSDFQPAKHSNQAVSRTVSTPLFSAACEDDEVDSDDSFEEVDEEPMDENFSPDEMVSSVLFPNSKKYSWMS